MNKRGIELSVNFLVVIILSLAVLAMGMVFITKIMNEGQDVIKQVTPAVDQELRKQLIGNRRVAVYPTSGSIKGKEVAYFAVGVRNTVASEPYFQLEVDCTDYYTLQGVSQGSSECSKVNAAFDNTMVKIENNEYKNFNIVISLDKTAEKGSYAISITVLSGSADPATVYMDPLLITVTKS